MMYAGVSLKVVSQKLLKKVVNSWKRIGVQSRDMNVDELKSILSTLEGDQMTKQDQDEELQK